MPDDRTMPVMPAAGEDSTSDSRRIAADAADEVRAPPILLGDPEAGGLPMARRFVDERAPSLAGDDDAWKSASPARASSHCPGVDHLPWGGSAGGGGAGDRALR